MKFLLPFLSLFILAGILLVPQTASAIDLNLSYPSFQGIDINTEEGQSLPKLIAWFYYFIVAISGLATFVMLVWGGIEWLSSGVNPGLQGKAKERIQNAIIGLLLVLSSVLIVRIINPEFAILQIPELQTPSSSPQPSPQNNQNGPGGSQPNPADQPPSNGPGGSQPNPADQPPSSGGLTRSDVTDAICDPPQDGYLLSGGGNLSQAKQRNPQQVSSYLRERVGSLVNLCQDSPGHVACTLADGTPVSTLNSVQQEDLAQICFDLL